MKSIRLLKNPLGDKDKAQSTKSLTLPIAVFFRNDLVSSPTSSRDIGRTCLVIRSG